MGCTVFPFACFFSQSGHCVPDVEICNVVHILGHLSGCFAEFNQRMLRFDVDFFNVIHIRNTYFLRVFRVFVLYPEFERKTGFFTASRGRKTLMLIGVCYGIRLFQKFDIMEHIMYYTDILIFPFKALNSPSFLPRNSASLLPACHTVSLFSTPRSMYQKYGMVRHFRAPKLKNY